MESSDREMFENVHGKCKNKLDTVQSELDKRKSAHKDLLQRLKLEKETVALRKSLIYLGIKNRTQNIFWKNTENI